LSYYEECCVKLGTGIPPV